MCNIDYLIQKDNRLKPVFGCILTFINKKLRNSEYNYVDTTLYELQKITKHKTKGATSKVVSKLCDWGYLHKELSKEDTESGWKHLRLRLGNCFTSRKGAQIAANADDFYLEKRFPKEQTNIYININKSNKSNKSIKSSFGEETKKNKIQEIPTNTTAQDMLAVYNEVTESNLGMSRKIAKFMYQAFKQKFHTIDRWREYLQFKIKGKIINKLAFLFYVLSFVVINDALAQIPEKKGEMKITETTELKQSAYNHINTLKESERCKEIRRKIVERRGANVYFSWFTKVKLEEVNGEIKLCSDNAFAKDWINTQYGWDLC